MPDITHIIAEGPIRGAVSINPAGNPTFTPPLRGLHANIAGTAVVTLIDGGSVTIAMSAGAYYPYPVLSLTTVGTTFLTGELIGLR